MTCACQRGVTSCQNCLECRTNNCQCCHLSCDANAELQASHHAHEQMLMHLELALQGLDNIAVMHLSEEKKSFWRKKLQDVYNGAKKTAEGLYKQAPKTVQNAMKKTVEKTLDVKKALTAAKEQYAKSKDERRKTKDQQRQTTPDTPSPGVGQQADTMEAEETAMPKMHGRAAANVYFTDLPLAGRNE